MSQVTANEDQSQSHYEISLTAGQAFVAFVLLLLSLAASFAFGLMIGKGQADERLVVRKDPAVINEASTIPKKSDGKLSELGVSSDDFKSTTKAASSASKPAATGTSMITEGTPATAAPSTETPSTETPASEPAPAASKPTTTAPVPRPVMTPAPSAARPAVTSATPAATSTQAAAPKPQTAVAGPVEAQLASIADQKAAEAMAAKLINKGFTSAYVDRGTNEKGTVWRVRVKFNSEAEAQAALPRLREVSKDIWITK